MAAVMGLGAWGLGVGLPDLAMDFLWTTLPAVGWSTTFFLTGERYGNYG